MRSTATPSRAADSLGSSRDDVGLEVRRVRDPRLRSEDDPVSASSWTSRTCVAASTCRSSR